MAFLKKTENEIRLKRKKFFYIVGAVLAVMGIIGVKILIDLLPIEGRLNLIGVVIIALWFSVVAGTGVLTFIAGSKRITINREGVRYASLFRKEFLKWDEIQDWGLSYCGRGQWIRNIYILYFAQNRLTAKNDEKKKLKGKRITYYIVGDEYDEMSNAIIPFCLSYTKTTPFLPKYKVHLL